MKRIIALSLFACLACGCMYYCFEHQAWHEIVIPMDDPEDQ